jgi:glycosyltransferase involved in cell wall biosynthesis
MKPRLLIITSSFPRSSSDETCGYIREFGRHLADEFEVTVLAPFDSPVTDAACPEFSVVRSKSFLPAALDPLRAGQDLNGVVARGGITRILLGVSLLAFTIRAFRLSLRADVICSHWMLPSGLIGTGISRLLNRPHVCVEHSGALHLLRGSHFGKYLTRMIVAGSQRMVVVSEDLRAKLLAICPIAKEKTEVIAMGIPGSAFSPCGFNQSRNSEGGNQGFTLGFIGRLVEIKGLHILLNALTEMSEVRLLIAGEGPCRGELERLAEQLNLNATFFGQVGQSEKAKILSACHAIVLPSLVLANGRTEGVPVVALEALAAGKPIIASRAGGLREIITDGENGLLFEAGNSRELTEKINLLWTDHRLQQHLSNKARQTATVYDWQVVSKRFKKIMRDVLRTNGSIESYQPTGAESR